MNTTTITGIFGNILPVNSSGAVDILFSPRGEVITQGLTADKIILWVRDVTQDGGINLNNPLPAGDHSLIVVYTHTGLIAAHQVYTGANTFATSGVVPGASTTVTLNTVSDIAVNDYLILDPDNAAVRETEQVISVNAPMNQITLGQVVSTHNAGFRVISDPYSYVRNAKSSGM